MPDLKIAASSLTRAYSDYKKQAAGEYSKSREERDGKFEDLMNKFKENKSQDEQNIEEFLEKICDFYVKNRHSGGFWSRPTLIKFIEQALYNIFEVPHPSSPNNSTDPNAWTDNSRKTLDNIIEKFKTDREKSHSEGISMRSFS